MADLRYNKSIVKNINESLIRRAMQGEGTFTKTKIAKDTGLSFPTVSRILDEMTVTGEILVKGVDSTTGGRHAKSYVVNPNFAYMLCIQIPRIDTISVLVADSCGGRIQEESYEADTGGMGFIDALDEIIEAKISEFPIKAISAAISWGISNGVLAFGAGPSGLQDFPLQKHLEEKFGIKTRIENDMNATVTGCYERMFSEEARSLVCIHFGSTSLGCGIYLRGHLIRGNHGFAGELRYLPLSEGHNLDKEYHEKVRIQEYCPVQIAQMVASICCTTDPQKIVFYDRMNIGEILDDVRKECRKYLPEEVIPEIVLSKDREEDCTNGLICFGRDLLMSGYEIVNR